MFWKRNSSYRPHPKDGEGSVFTGICLSTLGAVLKSWLGVPQFWPEGVPLSWDWVTPCQVRMGYPPTRTGVPPAGSGWDIPPARLGWGTPPQDRTAKRALATRRAVCLLRSRRTFLFSLILIQNRKNLISYCVSGEVSFLSLTKMPYVHSYFSCSHQLPLPAVVLYNHRCWLSPKLCTARHP